jgi:glycosyltransferase involved in cell wall biosynthesis
MENRSTSTRVSPGPTVNGIEQVSSPAVHSDTTDQPPAQIIPAQQPPIVTIIIATYNCATYLQSAIASVLDDPHPRKQLIIVDDGSSDDTQQLLSAYSPEVLSNIRIRNSGAAEARNTAWRLASGEYLLILDADDLVEPGSIQLRAALLQSHPEIDLVYGDIYRTDAAGSVTGPFPISDRFIPADDPLVTLATRNVFPVHAALVRRSALSTISPLHPTGDIIGDWELWARLAQRSRFLYAPITAGYYRQHPQMSLEATARPALHRRNATTLGLIQALPSFRRLPALVRTRSYWLRLCLTAKGMLPAAVWRVRDAMPWRPSPSRLSPKRKTQPR